MSLQRSAEIIELSLEKIGFSAFGAAVSAIVLFFIGGMQGLTDATLLMLLNFVGWTSLFASLIAVYQIFLVAMLHILTGFKGSGKILRNATQFSFSLLLFLFQGFVLVMIQ